jgi:hypothetical protein
MRLANATLKRLSDVFTHALPLWYLVCAYRRLLAGGFCPSPDGVERQLAMSRIRAGFSAPWLDFFYGCDALRQRHAGPLFYSLLLLQFVYPDKARSEVAFPAAIFGTNSTAQPNLVGSDVGAKSITSDGSPERDSARSGKQLAMYDQVQRRQGSIYKTMACERGKRGTYACMPRSA